MAAFAGKDRRVRARVALHGEVLGRIHTATAAPVIDLSENGALIEVPCVLRPGTAYTLRLPLSDGTELSLRCRVVRSYIHGFDQQAKDDESRVRYRAALVFTDLVATDRAAIRRQIESAATENFDVELDS